MISFARFLIIGVLCIIYSSINGQNQQPNIILILADDLGYGDLACYGHQEINTPHLDQLAKEGVKYTNFYSPSPLCSPSRASILTGRTAYRTGIKSWIPQNQNVYLHEEEKTIATILKEEGYQTFLSGKWHLNGGLDVVEHSQPGDHGFDAWKSFHAFPIPNHKNPVNLYEDGRPLGLQHGYTADIFVDQALHYLDSRDTDRPFFLYLPMAEPHSEIASPPSFTDQYSEFTKGEIDLEQLTDRGPGEYYANISYMDDQIGRVLTYVKDENLEQNTLIIFVSDNGPVNQEWRHWYEVNLYGETGGLRGRKADLFEGGIRVPCIMKFPTMIPAGIQSHEPAHGYDILPTICGLLDIETDANIPIDGIDISNSFHQQDLQRDTPLFWAFETRPDDNPYGFSYAVRDGPWKLLSDESTQEVKLYNLENDPQEVRDISKDHPAQVATLRKAIQKKIESIKEDPLRPRSDAEEDIDFTLFYTNDIESVYDPIDAYWIDTVRYIGGIPQLATLIQQKRAERELSFLFDAGDIFTGALSKSTLGVLPFEVYSTMGYDAMAIGNHEFEYGVKQLLESMQYARFPVLNANIFYEGTDINYARQYSIIERDGIRIGVISVMGIEAFNNTIFRDNRAGLEVRDPITIVQALVDQLKPQVDVIVALTHQNKSAPMQSDKEVDPEVQRGFHEDYAMAGAVDGLDVIFGGHSDHGLVKPVQHPKTGTWIGLTFGQGQHLGFMDFKYSKTDKTLQLKDGGLIPVISDKLTAHSEITEMIKEVRMANPDLGEVLSHNTSTGFRKYYKESNLGNFITDVCKEISGADIGFITPGAIRKDLDVGPITMEELLNIYPFEDRLAMTEISGKALKELIEYGLSLTYGFAQYSGVELTFNSDNEVGRRLVQARVNGKEIDEHKTYTVSSSAYSIKGGDGLSILAEGNRVNEDLPMMHEALIEYLHKQKELKLPEVGRHKDLGRK